MPANIVAQNKRRSASMFQKKQIKAANLNKNAEKKAVMHKLDPLTGLTKNKPDVMIIKTNIIKPNRSSK